MSVLRMSGFWQVFRDPKNHLNFVVFCQYNGQVPRKFPAFLEKLAQFLELTIPFWAPGNPGELHGSPS